MLALLLVTAVPVLASALRFTPLPPAGWLAACGLGLAMLLPFQWARRLLAPAATGRAAVT